jgi:hypothetical protein
MWRIVPSALLEGNAKSPDCILLVGTGQTTGVVATAAHVHQGAVDQNGPVIVTF